MKDQREGATFQIKVEGWSCLDYFWQYMSQWLEQIQGTAEFSPCKSTECSREKLSLISQFTASPSFALACHLGYKWQPNADQMVRQYSENIRNTLYMLLICFL